jgi:hypothetical protein
MPTFELAPVGADDFLTSTWLFPFSVDLNVDAATFWAELNGPAALSWCQLIRGVEWTSAPPRNVVGTTRTATLAMTGTALQERYFQWEESSDRYVNSFWVVASNTPGFRRFAERYEVVPTEVGCRFTWTFLVEPVLPSVSRLAKPLFNVVFKRFITDTKRHFR